MLDETAVRRTEEASSPGSIMTEFDDICMQSLPRSYVDTQALTEELEPQLRPGERFRDNYDF